MKELTKQLLTSKKFIVMLGGIIFAITAKWGFQIDESTIREILAIIGIYIAGQSVADFGKEAARIKADAPQPVETLNIQNVNTEQAETKKGVLK